MKLFMFLIKYKGTSYAEDINKTATGLSSIYYWTSGLTFTSGTPYTQNCSSLGHSSINRNIINFKKQYHI